MIQRYTREKMGAIWSQENRFDKMLEVEKAVAKAQAEMEIIPKKAAEAINKRAKVSIKRILEIEKETKHDVIAFVTVAAKSVGVYGRFIHYGMTSSDVLDTALSLVIRDAWGELNKSIKELRKSLRKQISKNEKVLCAGRTHGMHAEPTSFGLKLTGFLAELERNQERLERAINQASIVKLSGAVGTYSTQSEKVEARVGEILKLKVEVVATQVIPRDRHAEVICALAFLGAGLERLAVEFRHLQRTEVSEVIEGFSKGQKGSSAMPHKKNPISAENITGLSRLLRSYAQAALEDIALWHERDISHSSVERVIFPDAFIIAEYAVWRMKELVDKIVVNEERMKQNMSLSQGQLFSSHVLLALVDDGVSREEAYKMVQKASHSLKSGEELKEKILANKSIRKHVSEKRIDDIFSGKLHQMAISKVIQRALKTLQ